MDKETSELIEKIEAARRDVWKSYQVCLDPGVVIVDRRALDELLDAATTLKARASL